MEAGRSVKGTEDGSDQGDANGSGRKIENIGQNFRVEPLAFTDV